MRISLDLAISKKRKEQLAMMKILVLLVGIVAFCPAVSSAQEFCNRQAAVTVSASGNTQIIAAVSGQRIHICHISIAFASAVDVTLKEGTGTNCATGDVAITGTYKATTSLNLSFGREGPLRTGASQAFCVNLGTAVVGGGVMTFTQI